MSSRRHSGDDPDGLVTIGRFMDPMAAQLARSRLEADGLPCFVQGGGIGSLLPTATVYPLLLQVRAADAERGAELLAEEPAAGLLAKEREADLREPPDDGAGP